MYRLYGSPTTGSAAVEAALSAAGAKFEVTTVLTSDGQHLTEQYRAINPRQQVPALALPDGSVMTEGAAMLLHIADAFPQAQLAPPPGSSARAQHDRWLIFMAVNIYEGELRKAYPDRYTENPEDAEGVQSSADAYVKRHYDILEAAIGEGPFLSGGMLTMADIYLWMLSFWMDQDWLSSRCPKILALANAVRNRPAIAPVHAVHFG